MLDIRPKIGLLFLAGESWWDAGVCDAVEGPFAGFLARVQEDVGRATQALAASCDIVSPGLLHTVEEVEAAAARFNTAAVDAIVCCPIIWTNDAPIVALLRAARRVPLLLWAYDPYGALLDYYTLPSWLRASGPVSVQQASVLLRRYDWPYEVVFGNERDEKAQQTLVAFARAAAVRRSLLGTRIALLPEPCQVVMGSWCDEMELQEQFGVEVTRISVERYAALVAAVSQDDAKAYADWLKQRCEVVDTPDAMLIESAKHALAMTRLAEGEGLAGIALEDFNEAFYRHFGFRPHLYHPRLGALGCTVGLEADVPNVLATIIVSRIAGRMGMFNEFFSIDPAAGLVLMGHPGMGELSFGDPATFMVTPDLEFDASKPRGAWVSYRARPGRMTFMNLTPEKGGLQAAAFTGEALAGSRLMEGYAHMLVRPDTEARCLFEQIVRRGLIQHWGTVHGDVAQALRFLWRMYRRELVLL